MFGTKKQTLKIEGMMCAHCAARVEQALSKLEGVKGVKVDLASKTATVKVANPLPREAYETCVTEAGYKLIEVFE